MNTDKLQYKIDRMSRILDGVIELVAQYENPALEQLIAQLRIELEYLENLIQLIEDY